MSDYSTPAGLTEREAAERRARGMGNNVRLETSRSYAQIVRANLITFINLVLFGIGVALMLLGLYTDALLTVGIAFMNVVVGLFQEVRAKRALDKIALLTRPRAMLRREGQEREADPTEIVMGDVLRVGAGDQIVVDGRMLEGRMDVDESLLTGESDLIPKQAGDAVYSGSYCVNGGGLFETEKVGAGSVANQLTAGARAFRQVKTPLQTDIELVVRLLLALCSGLAFVYGVNAFVMSLPATETAKIAAVVTGLIPNGLFFMITIAYSMGAVRMAGRGALIQQANAVESMSNVNVLCLDKTGTLTANRILLRDIVPLEMPEADLRRILAAYAASTGAPNRTSEALHTALQGTALAVAAEVPFSSERKWSAIGFNGAELHGTYVLGAPEILLPFMDAEGGWLAQLDEWTTQGLRALLFCECPGGAALLDAQDQPILPAGLRPLGLLSFSDELRPEAQATLQGFAAAGIRLKIISGDNPQTVAALARQAGLQGDIQLVTGPELEAMTPAQFAEAADTATIFGRITPQQKERLVDSLRASGHYVAMIGDGVNDVLSLKKAHIGIAMQSGSQATRGVADIVLMGDSFVALPPAFQEGQRIINGMVDIMGLFLSRVVFQTLIIVGASLMGLGFPITPVHMSLLSLFAVGLPTMALAAWSRPGVPKGRLIASVLRFVLPAGLLLALVSIIVYGVYYVALFTASAGANTLNLAALPAEQISALEAARGMTISAIAAQAQADALPLARTVLTTLTTFAGLLLIVFAEPPTLFWTGGDDLAGDWRPTWMALGLAGVFIVISLVPGLRDFFELTPLELRDWVVCIAATAGWALLLRFVWRSRLLDRFLRL